MVDFALEADVEPINHHVLKNKYAKMQMQDKLTSIERNHCQVAMWQKDHTDEMGV